MRRAALALPARPTSWRANLSIASDMQRPPGDAPSLTAHTDLEQAERARGISVALYDAVQRAALDGILLVDANDKIVSCNPRFVEIWGLPPELVASKSDAHVLEVVADQAGDRETFLARVRELYADRDGNSRDEILLKDGRIMDRYSAPVKLEDGSYIGRVWFFRDITEHKRADDKIREDASQFRGLVEQQIAGIFIIAIDGTLAYINSGFSALFGYTPTEVVGRPFIDVIVEKDKEPIHRAFAEHLRGSPAATQTITAIKKKDGTLVDVLAHASVASYHDRPALIGIIIDITKQQRAAELLQASEERFRLLVDQAPDAIVLYDVDTALFVDANKSAELLFGCSREILLRIEPRQFILPDLPDGSSTGMTFADHVRQALSGDKPVFERRFRNIHGREGVCEVRLTRLPTVAGRLLRASLIDVTERRQGELALAYRERLLHAVAVGVAELVAAPTLAAGMPLALRAIAEALHVDRILVLEHSGATPPTSVVSMAHAWQAPDVPALDAAVLARLSRDSPDFAEWLAPLLEGKEVIIHAATAHGRIGQIMSEMHNLSTLLVPISVAGKYWGLIGVDDCNVDRQWLAVELDMLAILSQAIGALVMRETAQTAMQNSEERFRAVSDTARDAIVMVDSTGHVEYWNRAAERIFGYTTVEAMGKSVHEWLAPARYHDSSVAAMSAFAATGRGSILGRTLEFAAIRKDGVEFPIELSVASMLLGLKWHAVATIRDITERKRAAEEVTYTATHDHLTGLANRAVFVDALQQAIVRAQRHGESFAVLYLDLDHFKDVNDTLGHPVGDLLLQALGNRLRTSIRGTDTVARFGGDEFALIQTNIPEPIDAAVLATNLLKTISLPFKIQGNEILCAASVGIAVYGLENPSAETLLSHADVALYRAKTEGRATYRFFTDAMDVEVRTRVTLGTELRDALASGQIFLMYQPQIDVDTGRFVGVEALARWQHPTRGMVPPELFVPIAEQGGLIVALGNWVLREACRQMKAWIDSGIAPPLMAVNVSGLQFKTPFALERELAAILAATALQPQRLELELTEGVLMEVSRAHNDTILRLRKAGHRIAIDDFGTGYSSLEYLGRFPVDRIKIAQCFIVNLTSASGNSMIVKAALGLARDLNLDVVVEGVETAEQLQLVRSWGCREVQGYYFSRPLPAEELSVLLRAGAILPAPAIPVAAAAD